MKNQPERLRDRGAHIVAAGGQDISDLCECEAERAAILEHEAGMAKEAAETLVRQARQWDGVNKLCDRCPRGKS